MHDHLRIDQFFSKVEYGLHGFWRIFQIDHSNRTIQVEIHILTDPIQCDRTNQTWSITFNAPDNLLFAIFQKYPLDRVHVTLVQRTIAWIVLKLVAIKAAGCRDLRGSVATAVEFADTPPVIGITWFSKILND